MFRRFVSGIAIPSILIPFGALVVLVAPPATQERIYPLTVVWCFVPAVWGLWAMFAPAGWVPQRLPLWGAILGVIAGFLGVFVLNLPSRIWGETVPIALGGVAVVVIVLFYYFLWMLVRAAYRSLGTPTSAG
ncbi:MAG TPA: hypothetical protein VM182_07705 [Terriglobia bacterium]|nr:hypothetical protein [Terriglobia bacterium]